MAFKKATKEQSRLRLALSGASGGGKTYSALAIATALGKRVALIDTEHGSAAKYSNIFDFDVMEITGDYHPDRFIRALNEAAEGGYDVVVGDSLTHFWNGPGGFLDLVDKEGKRSVANGRKADSFSAWKELTPVYNRLIQAILGSPMHVIVTLRAKQEYEKADGKIRKLGVAPEMRDGFQYEMDIEGLLNEAHDLIIGKTRCPDIDGKLFPKPGKEFAGILRKWLDSGVPARDPVIDLVTDPPETMPPAATPSDLQYERLSAALRAHQGIPAELRKISDEATQLMKERHITKDAYESLGRLYMQMKQPAVA